MALTTATISYNIADLVGSDFDSRRTKVWVSTNVDNDTIVDTVGNQIRLGDGMGTIADDGTGSVSVWAPGTGSNPASWQTTIHVDYAQRRPGAARVQQTFGPFTVTADANLADLIQEQAVPATYLSEVTGVLQGYVDEAQAARDEAVDLSGIDTSDALVSTLVADPDSETAAAMSTAVATVAQTHTTVLAPWQAVLRTDPASAKVALVGPSTVDIAAAGVSRHDRWKFHIVPGGPLEGMVDANILNFGYNGQTGDQITSGAHMTALAAAAPHLINASGLLINTVRATAWTLADLTAALAVYVERIRAARPGVPIILETGNTLLSADVGGNGFVNPNGDAQVKSDLMRNAHLALLGRWPDVLVVDVQTEVYGRTSLATHPYMTDQLHPNPTGMGAEVDNLIPLVGYVRPFAPGRNAAARAASPYAPWTSYGRVVEDADYFVPVARAAYQNQGSTYFDFAYPAGQRSNIRPGDLVELPGGVTFAIPSGSSISANGSTTRVVVGGSVIPANTLAAARGQVLITRLRRPVEQGVADVAADTTWRYKRIGFVAGTPNQNIVDITADSFTAAAATEPGSAWAIVAGDRVYIDGMQAVTGAAYFTIGTDATLGTNGTNFRISGLATFDRSSLIARKVVIVGTHA